MDTKKLRQKILDLAIRGKLVPQDPNDEPASVLLERIKAEKERLIKEGKIKRSKKTAKTSDTPHYPYLLPNGWEWCKLEDIVSFGGGKTPAMDNKEYWHNGNHLWVTSKDMKCSHITNSLMKITDKALEIMTIYERGTLLVVTRSGILRHTLPISILEAPATVNQDLKAISPHIKDLSEYLYIVIKANEHFILKEYHKDGTTVDSIDFDKFKCLPIPLAPITEQRRIIAETKHWFTLIEQINQGKSDLQTIINQIKNKILSLAIHGKLVPQDPNDEPASELLKRINPSAKITCDNAHYQNLPFNIPSKWIWTTLGQIGKWQSGSTPNRLNKDYYGGNIPWLKTGDLNDGYITHISENITEKALNETPVKLNPKGCVLIAMYGATIGKIGMLTYPATTNQACCACDVLHGIEKEYLFYFLLSYREKFIKLGSGGAQPNISKEKIINTYIPIPPHSEQKRIVATIHKIFAKLDTITESL